MTQENWPFENAITGIAVREDFAGEPCDCDHRINEPHEEGCPALERDEYDDGMAANDVFIVEDRDTQEKIDVVKNRMTRNYGYCEICSTDVLNFVASIFARGDVKE
jgi:hypothetical protein